MGDENPNAQVEANLLEGKGRYASAGTTLQDIKNNLDGVAAGLQSSWLGGASQGYQDKYGKLTTTVQSAGDVLQKGSTSIGKMHDSYIEADEKQKAYKQVNGVLEKFMGVFMLFTAALGVVGAFLELADVAFAAEIGALEAAVEVSDVAADVTADVGIEEVDTLSSLDNVSNIDPLAEENPVPVDTPSQVPPEEAPVDPPQEAPADPPQDTPVEDPQEAPVDPPQEAPADPPQEAPADPPQDTPVEDPQEAPADPPQEAPADPPQDTPVEDPQEAPADPPQDTPVEDPQTDEAPPVDQPSEEPAPESSKHDSGVDMSSDDKESLGKLDEPTVSETPKEIAPQDPITVNVVEINPTTIVQEFNPEASVTAMQDEPVYLEPTNLDPELEPSLDNNGLDFAPERPFGFGPAQDPGNIPGLPAGVNHGLPPEIIDAILDAPVQDVLGANEAELQQIIANNIANAQNAAQNAIAAANAANLDAAELNQLIRALNQWLRTIQRFP